MPARPSSTRRRFPRWLPSSLLLPARFVRDGTGTRLLRRGLLGRELVLGRDLVHFEYVTFPEDLSAVQRQKALALKVQAGSPYAQTGHLAVWRGAAAQVWFWDTKHVADARRALVLPETLLHPPLEHGVRLLQLSQGFEAQSWHDGQLRASRFWLEKPDLDQWRQFIRHVGGDASQWDVVPAGEPAPWLDHPYARGAGQELGRLRQQANKLWLAAFAVLGLALLWQGLTHLKYQQCQERLQHRIAQLREQNQPLIEAQSEALSQLEAVQALARLLDRPTPLKIMDDLLRIMPKDIHIQRFKLAGKDLIVEFTGKDLFNTAKLIARIQTLPYVASVSTGDTREGQLELKLELVR